MHSTPAGPSPADTSDVTWHHGEITADQRATIGATVWLTGLSGSGKSSVAVALERMLVQSGSAAVRLDGDNLRHGLNADLGFSAEDRVENVRRVGEVAKLFAEAGVVAIVPLISPFRSGRDAARHRHSGSGLRFVEVYVDTPIEECERRDPKGLYVKARAGQITGFTGIDDPYEAPLEPELTLRPSDGDPDTQAARIVELLERSSSAAVD